MGCCSALPKKSEKKNLQRDPGKRETVSKKDFIRLVKGSLTTYYEILQKIGEGSFGQVKIVKHKISSNKRVAKTLLITPEFNTEKLLEEANILKNLDHPNIIHIYEIIADSRSVNIIMEYCTGGELFERIRKMKKFSETTAASYLTDIVLAIKYCHEANIVHRDLKPENILFESANLDARLKIIDFGTSQYLYPTAKLNKFIGSSYYVAPEVLENYFDEKCDVWSIGVIFYIMLSGVPPFNGKSDPEIFKNIRTEEVGFKEPIWKNVTEEAKDLIRKMLVKDPVRRVSIHEVFLHPWIQNHLNGKVLDGPLAKQVLKNLSNFSAQSNLKKIILNYIVSQLVTNEELNSLREVFEKFDKNGNGKITKDELLQGFLEFSDEGAVDIDKIMQECDVDQNGFLDYTEFLTAAGSWKKSLTEECLLAAFKSFDSDGNGKISLEEFLAGFQGSDLNADYLEGLMKSADLNADGEIDYQEFHNLMRRTINQA